MSRVQLTLNVPAIDEAVEFYSKLFATEPARRRPGYAKFAVADPPLKLVLIENPQAEGALNHLGVEVATTEEVARERGRLQGAGLLAADEKSVECCYALQDKVWVGAPGGEPWDFYTVHADSDVAGDLSHDDGNTSAACCTSGIEVGAAASSCC